nr:MAG TPA: hypothetical protein [Bacteriophage sp.]
MISYLLFPTWCYSLFLITHIPMIHTWNTITIISTKYFM